jgi:hypothetical protein
MIFRGIGTYFLRKYELFNIGKHSTGITLSFYLNCFTKKNFFEQQALKEFWQAKKPLPVGLGLTSS